MLSLCLTNWALLLHEVVCGSGCIDPHFLDLSISWRWVVSFTPRPLYPRERAPGTHWIGGWVGPRAGLDDMEKRKFLTLPGLELCSIVVSRTMSSSRQLIGPLAAAQQKTVSYCCAIAGLLSTATVARRHLRMRCITLRHTCMGRCEGNASTVLLRHPAGVPRDRYPGKELLVPIG
jgi:hypothetical protein